MRFYPKLYYSAILFFVIGLSILTSQSAQAHPADMYFQTHTIHLTPDGIRLTWSIYPGPLLVPLVYSAVDQDRNSVISPAEAQAWIASHLPEFSANLDGALPLEWDLESVEWPSSITTFQVGDEVIFVHLRADWPPNLTGKHQLTLHNQYQEVISVNWFYLHSAEGVSFCTPSQDNGRLLVDLLVPAAASPAQPLPAASEDEGQTYWDSGTPSLPAVGPELIALQNLAGLEDEITGEAVSSPPQDRRPITILTNLVRTPELSVSFYLLALGVAAVLGALHSLTPGHGKTVVAAYLVGSRGTTWHAISLGTIVTLTHTGSVFVLGLLTLVASQYILPTSLFPVLEIVSGLLIVGLGTYLLTQRWRAWRTTTLADSHHRHDHEHHHHHHHHVPDVSGVTWRSLVTLGISGGLVPCPDAIAILLVAIAIKRIVLGLSLIVAFSLGLALVLIIIGLAMVHSRRLFQKMDTFSHLAPVMPLISAVVVLGLGLLLTFSAVVNLEPLTVASEFPEANVLSSLDPDNEPSQESPEPGPTSPPFRIDQASILYIDSDEQGKSQVFRVNLAGGDPLPLTQNPAGVQDYALSPQGTTVVYTAIRADGGSDLWRIDPTGREQRELLVCPGSVCSGAVWSPDGQRLVYERLNPPSPTAPAGLPSLWWLDPTTSQTEPIFQDSQWPGFNPRWSPDGQWLSYAYPGSGKMELYNLNDGRRISIPTQTGAPVIWSPQANALLVADIWNEDELAVIHLFRFDLDGETLTDLSQAVVAPTKHPVIDSAATWSPDGEWLALVRREVTGTGAVKSGSRIWLMRPDGSEARVLTDASKVIHGTPVWSPDGKYLLFHTYSLAEGLTTKIHFLNIETGKLQEVVASGSRPTWAP